MDTIWTPRQKTKEKLPLAYLSKISYNSKKENFAGVAE